MSVYLSYFSLSQSDLPRGGAGDIVEVLRAQVGDRETLTVSSAAANGAAASSACVVRIVAEDKCAIKIGTAAVAEGSKGDVLLAGSEAVRWLRAGERVSIISVA